MIVRAGALGTMLGFLRHNTPTLVTLDVARRVASLVSNALGFANAFISAQQGQVATVASPDGTPQVDGKTVSGETRLRQRVYQCFTLLGFAGVSDATQTTLLQSTVLLFAGPDSGGSALQAAVATSAGNFNGLWSLGDGYAFGVTSINIENGEEGNEEGRGGSGESSEGRRDTE